MKLFNRTVEKVLAWIANVLFIIYTVVISILAFSGGIESLGSNADFIAGFNQSLRESGNTTTPGIGAQDAANLVAVGAKVYSVLLIIVLILALVATFTMKSRILSGVFFVLAAIGSALLSGFLFFPIYLAYLVVGIMMFVRKEEQFNPMYVNQNPYVNNGANNYGTDNNGNVYNQNVEGTNYQATNGEQNQEQKVDKIEYL